MILYVTFIFCVLINIITYNKDYSIASITLLEEFEINNLKTLLK